MPEKTRAITEQIAGMYQRQMGLYESWKLFRPALHETISELDTSGHTQRELKRLAEGLAAGLDALIALTEQSHQRLSATEAHLAETDLVNQQELDRTGDALTIAKNLQYIQANDPAELAGIITNAELDVLEKAVGRLSEERRAALKAALDA